MYDFQFDKGEGIRNKICFYIWSVWLRANVRHHTDAEADIALVLLHRAPDNAKIKQKMVYASSKDALRRTLVGVGADIQGTDLSEIAYESGAYSKTSHRAKLRLSCSRAVLDKVSRK